VPQQQREREKEAAEAEQPEQEATQYLHGSRCAVLRVGAALRLRRAPC
jgi:hypothetical protein